jgi:hypothetical protein
MSSNVQWVVFGEVAQRDAVYRRTKGQNSIYMHDVIYNKTGEVWANELTEKENCP